MADLCKFVNRFNRKQDSSHSAPDLPGRKYAKESTVRYPCTHLNFNGQKKLSFQVSGLRILTCNASREVLLSCTAVCFLLFPHLAPFQVHVLLYAEKQLADCAYEKTWVMVLSACHFACPWCFTDSLYFKPQIDSCMK